MNEFLLLRILLLSLQIASNEKKKTQKIYAAVFFRICKNIKYDLRLTIKFLEILTLKGHTGLLISLGLNDLQHIWF